MSEWGRMGDNRSISHNKTSFNSGVRSVGNLRELLDPAYNAMWRWSNSKQLHMNKQFLSYSLFWVWSCDDSYTHLIIFHGIISSLFWNFTYLWRPRCIPLGSRLHPTKKCPWTVIVLVLCSSNSLESNKFVHCVFI